MSRDLELQVHKSRVVNVVRVMKADEDDYRIGGYAIAFGSADETDNVGDFFTPKTDLWLKQYGGRSVLCYEHLIRGDYDRGILGEVVKMQPDDFGLWYEAKLTAEPHKVNRDGTINVEEEKEIARRQRDNVMELAEKGDLGTSTGSVNHFVRKRHVRDNVFEIERWPVVECSVTPQPAEGKLTGDVRPLKAYEGIIKKGDMNFIENAAAMYTQTGGEDAATLRLAKVRFEHYTRGEESYE